jgi:tetratricopeptide (TPR) repeat protein
MYLSKGGLDKAVDVYQQGITAAPEDLNLSLGLANIHERQQQYDDAIAVYEQLLEKKPDNVVVINNLAVLLSDHREDIASLNRAKELASKLAESNQPALLDTLGWIHYRLGEYDEAAEVLSGVVVEAPDVPVFRYHLGMTYYKQGDNRAARDILSKTVAEEYTYAGVDEARRVYEEISKE